MKTLISKGWAFAAAVAAIVSCTKNVEEEKPSINEGPKFPEKQQIEIPAGEQKVLTFTAEADWKLVIDKTTWCAFIDNGVETAQISGKAGEVNATVAVKDNGLGFTSDVAKIDLTLDTKTETIYEITRPGKAREIKLYAAIGYGAEYAECKAIELSADEQVNFTIVANYDWTAAAPEGFKFQSKDYTEIPGLSGTAGVGPEDKDFNYATIIVADETIPYEKNAKIVVTDTEGKNPVEFPLHYSGMDENIVNFEPQNIAGTAMITIGLPFSAEGFKIEKSDPYSSGTVTTEKTASFSVQAKNMKYAVHKIGIIDDNAFEFGENSWVSIADDNAGRITVSVSENDGKTRKAYILVLSEAADKNFKIADFYTDGRVNAAYSQFTVMVTQNGSAKAQNFKVQWSRTSASVSTVPFGEYSMFEGKNASDFASGSCDSNAYVAEITEANLFDTQGGISGALQFAPLGFPEDYYPIGSSEETNLFRFEDQADVWDLKNISGSSIFDMTTLKDIRCIQIDPEQFINVETLTSKNFQGMAIVQFYKNAEDKAAYKSSATLVIVKK